jgi:hypothetical protein
LKPIAARPFVHDGYWPVEHQRHVLVMHGDLVVVADLICGPGSHTAAVHWHVDPRWTAKVTNSRVDLIADKLQCRMVAMPGPVETFVADQQTGLGWHSPLYGRLVPSTTLRITAGGETPFWIVTVLGLDARNGVRTAEWRPVVEVHPRTIAHAVGIRIIRDLSVDDVLIAEAVDAVRGATCRSGTIETDAHLLFWRAASRQQPPKVALVDGSFVRATGSEPQVALPARVSDFHMETVCAA